MENYPKGVIEQAEALIEAHRPYANTWDCYWDIPLDDGNAIKAALVSIELVINNCKIQDGDFWQQVKEYLENKLKEL